MTILQAVHAPFGAYLESVTNRHLITFLYKKHTQAIYMYTQTNVQVILAVFMFLITLHVYCYLFNVYEQVSAFSMSSCIKCVQSWNDSITWLVKVLSGTQV